jgi:hypothetical protein
VGSSPTVVNECLTGIPSFLIFFLLAKKFVVLAVICFCTLIFPRLHVQNVDSFGESDFEVSKEHAGSDMDQNGFIHYVKSKWGGV